MANQSIHPLQDIRITAEEKSFNVIETNYKYNERTDKYDYNHIESKVTTTYHAVLWRNFVFVRKDGKHEYEALCGMSARKFFGESIDCRSTKWRVIDFPFYRQLEVEDKYLVIPSRINGKPVTNVHIDNCKSCYMICPTTVTMVWFDKCDYLEKFIGDVPEVWILGKNKYGLY